jgi:metal-dependent amidase/aminoacylase/carboxypeptidase family protein
MASSDMFRIVISGRSAHCGQRHLGADALLTAVDIVKAFPEIQSASKDPEAVLFCGNLESGHSHNVVPDSATIRGTIRTFDPADRRAIKEKLVNFASAAAKRFETNAKVIWEGGCPPVCNDEMLIRHLQKLIPDMDLSISKTFVAEDFSCYQEKAPGVLLWLGTGDSAPLHNDRFCIPRQILPVGVQHWVDIATEDWKENGL